MWKVKANCLYKLGEYVLRFETEEAAVRHARNILIEGMRVKEKGKEVFIPIHSITHVELTED